MDERGCKIVCESELVNTYNVGLLTAIAWGFFADKHGRKRMILMITVAIAAGMTWM